MTLVGSGSSTRPFAATAALYVRPSGVWTLAVESLLSTGSENWRSTAPGAAPNRWPAVGLDETRVAWARAVAGTSMAPRPAARAARIVRESHARLPFTSPCAAVKPTILRDRPGRSAGWPADPKNDTRLGQEEGEARLAPT